MEIAGNDEITLTVLVPATGIPQPAVKPPAAEEIFSTKILTDPQWRRIGMRTAVGSLHAVLNDPAERGVRIEHVYDY